MVWTGNYFLQCNTTIYTNKYTIYNLVLTDIWLHAYIIYYSLYIIVKWFKYCNKHIIHNPKNPQFAWPYSWTLHSVSCHPWTMRRNSLHNTILGVSSIILATVSLNIKKKKNEKHELILCRLKNLHSWTISWEYLKLIS